MKINKIKPVKPKAKVALQGASGSGKTYSALLLAYGLCGAYEKITIIETDYLAAHHYSYLGAFNTLTLDAPFTPQKFIDAIELCEQAQMDVIIIDTLSAEWAGIGGMQEMLAKEGDACMHWHQSLLRTIEKSLCHIIVTVRAKECFHLSIIGKVREVSKIGLDPIQEEGIHYHFHTVLSLDMNHKVKALKDRTSFFKEHSAVVITEEIAALYAKWCSGGSSEVSAELLKLINACKSIKELLALMYQYDIDHQPTMQAFTSRRIELEGALHDNPIYSIHKSSKNGKYNHRA